MSSKKHKKLLSGIMGLSVGGLLGMAVYSWTDYFWLQLLTSIAVIISSIIIIFKNIVR